MNRRRFLALGAGIAGIASAPTTPDAVEDHEISPDGAPGAIGPSRRSIDRAYHYLDVAMDAYQRGRTPRLIQSFADSQDLGSTAFVYDNSLAVLAYLGRRAPRDLARARRLGDSFLYAQAHDAGHADGRVRQAYWVGPFTLPFAANDAYFVRDDGTVNLVGAPWFFQGSSVSDMSWVGIALAQLFARTRQGRYLEGAVRLGRWIVDNAFDTTGLGGYSFGVDADNRRLSALKRTEHNNDVYGFFTHLLAPLTGDGQWRELGQHALAFIERMWDDAGGFFYIGSDDGATITRSPVLEEVQSQGYQALLDPRYAAALDWTKTNLVGTDTPQSRNAGFGGNVRFTGVSFSDASRRAVESSSPSDPVPDPDAVWLEGAAHMVAALRARRYGPQRDRPTFPGDLPLAAEYASHIALAQAELGRDQTVNGVPIPDGAGVVAATSVLNTGTGFSYYPNLHLAATSWYLIAARGRNPYRR